MTRDVLAMRAGVSVSMIARLELSGHLPGPRKLMSITAALSLPADALLPQAGPAQDRADIPA